MAREQHAPPLVGPVMAVGGVGDNDGAGDGATPKRSRSTQPATLALPMSHASTPQQLSRKPLTKLYEHGQSRRSGNCAMRSGQSLRLRWIGDAAQPGGFAVTLALGEPVGEDRHSDSSSRMHEHVSSQTATHCVVQAVMVKSAVSGSVTNQPVPLIISLTV